MPVMSARFKPATLLGSAVPAGVQLVQELVAPLRLVDLADGLRRRPQTFERAQEAAVGLVVPPDVSRSAPARLAQAVEAAVIADAEVRVRLDVVARELPEPRPRVEELRPARTHVGDCFAPTPDGAVQRGAQRVERVVGLAIEHGLGYATRSESHLRHERMMLSAHTGADLVARGHR